MLEITQSPGPTDQGNLQQIQDLLARSKSIFLGKYAHDRNIPIEEIFDFELAKISQHVHDPHVTTRILSNRNTGQIFGLTIAEWSAWDSEHFGKNIGKITLAVFDLKVTVEERVEMLGMLLAECGFDLTSARINLCDLATIQALEASGAILTDVLLTLRYDAIYPPHHSTISSAPFEISQANTDDLDKLTQIARNAFTADRFHNDPHLPRPKSDEVYPKWTANSLHGMADAFIVARDGDSIAGFVTCKIQKMSKNHSVGIIELVAVHPEYAGKNVGSSLVDSAVQWFESRVKSVYVGTQAANPRAARLYEKCQFRQVCAEATFHLWRESQR